VLYDALKQVNDGNGGIGAKDMENELLKLEKQLDSDDELYCVACDKHMRNEKAFVSHMKQKKHLENQEMLDNIQDQLKDGSPVSRLLHNGTCNPNNSTYSE